MPTTVLSSLGIWPEGQLLPWETQVSVEDGHTFVIYATVGCVILHIFFRQLLLLLLPAVGREAGIAPRLATKFVSLLLNLVHVQGAVKHLLAPDPATLRDRVYGYSAHSQFHFAVAAGYFMWAAGTSTIYKGSRMAIFYYGTCCALCFFGLHPFMHHMGNVFLLSQLTNLVLDIYGCGILLKGPRTRTNVTLRFLHPFFFFVVRILITVPISFKFVTADLLPLLFPTSPKAPQAHNTSIVWFVLVSTVCINLLNVFWFLTLLSSAHTSSPSGVTSVTLGRQQMKVKWFAFNLNWFDVGFTLSYGDVRVGTGLKIDNSSYERVTPGFTVPAVIVAVCVKLLRVVEVSDEPFWESLAITAGTIIAVKVFKYMNHRSLKLGVSFVTDRKTPSPATEPMFHKVPTIERMVSNVNLAYSHIDASRLGGDETLLDTVMSSTPKPKGRPEFTSIHVIAPPKSVKSNQAEKMVFNLELQAGDINKELVVHRLLDCCTGTTPMDEYLTVMDAASALVLKKSDRASLVIFVGWEDTSADFYAPLIAMLPFRGLSLALITQRKEHGNVLAYKSRSGVFEVEANNAARMGMFPVKAVFGSLTGKKFNAEIEPWRPVNLKAYIDHPNQENHPTINLPFKIGALTLPMLTHNGSYANSIASLTDLMAQHYSRTGVFPIISCGETCDALGYGSDILDALSADKKTCPIGGYYFTHRSGETYKCYENYGTAELFAEIAKAKSKNVPVCIIAVGGGVNGNCIGLIAGITSSSLIEIPTTPMHYNDATTSAKKAFSLVQNNKILSKNILGLFYIPELVFNISESFLTLSTANVHATIGESCKTMNMLGRCDSAIGAQDYFNIEGAVEFSSDYTKIVLEVGGFDTFVDFIESDETRKLKAAVIATGALIRKDRKNEKLLAQRQKQLKEFRERYYALGQKKTDSVKKFLSTVNKEIVSAKAMFLAYSDPFEKYRALLFEYAHTLGHGVEAYANLCYTNAIEKNVPVPEEAQRLHGQCVGMAVLMAGQMSNDLGELKGDSYAMHQSLVYLFNRHGGFDFTPLRRLFDTLNITKEEFCEGVLDVVRRDNKRGYIACADCTKSVDQLVTGRLGKMMRSTDKNAELRYLVEVDEDWQKRVLGMAFDGKFDKVADIDDEGRLKFRERSKLKAGKEELVSNSTEVGEFLHEAIAAIYGVA